MDDILSKKPKVKEAVPQKPTIKVEKVPEPVAPAVVPKEEKPAAQRGRPQEHIGGSDKCTVVLRKDQIKWLKLLEHAIYSNTDTTISRAELIRAMIDAVIASGIDLSHLNSEEAIKEYILTLLRKTK